MGIVFIERYKRKSISANVEDVDIYTLMSIVVGIDVGS